MTPLLIRGRLGLGDNVYQRSIVREVTDRFDVYLETPWPQLVADLPIRCIRRPTKLRTQEKNAARRDLARHWHAPPSGIEAKVIGYPPTGTLLQGFCATLGVRPHRVNFDLPAFASEARSQPYVVIRPATVRAEFPAEARNPRPEYLALAADKLRAHFHIVTVADLAPGVEWPVGDLPYADERFHAGELQVEQLMALVAGAAGCVGGVGWIAPAAVAYQVPLFVIYGGCGQHDGPARIFDHRMPIENVHHAIPDRFCLCSNRSHNCDKRITSIAEQVEAWTVRLAARRAAAVASGTRDRVLQRDGESLRA